MFQLHKYWQGSKSFEKTLERFWKTFELLSKTVYLVINIQLIQNLYSVEKSYDKINGSTYDLIQSSISFQWKKVWCSWKKRYFEDLYVAYHL